jgi:hypothetical protein
MFSRRNKVRIVDLVSCWPPLFQLYSNVQNGTHLVLFVPKSCLEQMKLIPFVDNRFAFGIHKWNKWENLFQNHLFRLLKKCSNTCCFYQFTVRFLDATKLAFLSGICVLWPNQALPQRRYKNIIFLSLISTVVRCLCGCLLQ